MIKAKVIADSINSFDNRLTTIEVVIPRFILSQLNTHRQFSRNSASSRAIPFSKKVTEVLDNPAMPVEWGSNQPGMQAGALLDDMSAGLAEYAWLQARDAAVEYATRLNKEGVHKEIVNRILEPFSWHTVIVSATQWENFWHQRISPLSQPDIRVAAEAMRMAYVCSEPVFKAVNEYHTPYIHWNERNLLSLQERIKISTARCARVSYMTHEGVRDTAKDVELYDRLYTADPPHFSPMEHVATPMSMSQTSSHGNFRGWIQHRYEIELQRGMDTTL
jgi:thymidylate synthase ThyX